MEFLKYFFGRIDEVSNLLWQHINLTIVAVLIAIFIGVPLGIIITKNKKLATPIIGVTNVIQAIPSLALLGFLIPFIGIGSKPAVVMVFLYSLLPIVKNTYTGLININPDMIEAGKGMGMTEAQLLRKVQLPLALPIIMAGIRIASVTAVGLMTIAAFVGAGGLGYMVFTGVQTVNNYMILSGAIPACILALIMDFVIGKVENAVVPEGIQAATSGRKNKKRVTPKKQAAIIAVTVAVFAIVVLFANGSFTNKGNMNDTIVIGSKNYNEQLILGNMMATLIEEKTDLNVDRQLNLGGSQVIFEAIKSGDIDLYAEYSGTAFVNYMQREPISDKAEVYNIISDYFHNEYGIKWLEPLGFNNTYVVAVRQDTAQEYGLETISDLAKVSDELVLGCTMEFSDREDGYVGLSKTYNMKFKEVTGIDGGLRYTAINENETDAVDAFGTDGLLKKFNLKPLEDDKNFFPGYYPAPIIREDVLEEHPELEEVLNILGNAITQDEMIELNYRADEGEDPKAVAEDFLREKGFID
ncbi:ABC transporter permease/substrate-binding protein [Clostridium sp. DL1XJH146]